MDSVSTSPELPMAPEASRPAAKALLAAGVLLLASMVAAASWSVLVEEDGEPGAGGARSAASGGALSPAVEAGGADQGGAASEGGGASAVGPGWQPSGLSRPGAGPDGRDEPSPAAGRSRRRAGPDEPAARPGAYWPGGLGLRGKATSRRRAGGSARRAAATEQPEQPEQEFASIRDYLAAEGEDPARVRDEAAIADAPSNVVAGDDQTTLLAWDPRLEEPLGSYLYVLEQDGEGRVAQVHRYFCPERRLDVLAEICVPIATVYSDHGVPVAVAYGEDGAPGQQRADDLDPRRFSRHDRYVEGNELLLLLQDYFDSMRD